MGDAQIDVRAAILGALKTHGGAATHYQVENHVAVGKKDLEDSIKELRRISAIYTDQGILKGKIVHYLPGKRPSMKFFKEKDPPVTYPAIISQRLHKLYVVEKKPMCVTLQQVRKEFPEFSRLGRHKAYKLAKQGVKNPRGKKTPWALVSMKTKEEILGTAKRMDRDAYGSWGEIFADLRKKYPTVEFLSNADMRRERLVYGGKVVEPVPPPPQAPRSRPRTRAEKVKLLKAWHRAAKESTMAEAAKKLGYSYNGLRLMKVSVLGTKPLASYFPEESAQPSQGTEAPTESEESDVPAEAPEEEAVYSIYVKGPDFAHAAHRIPESFAKALVLHLVK